MSARRRLKQKGRQESGTFSLIPHSVQDSSNWATCSPTGIKLLLDLFRQYNGHNNGDLCSALSLLAPRGWTRSQTVSLAARELCHYGLLEQTRQGDLHRASLYAVTWKKIDACRGKPDVRATSSPSGAWKEPHPEFVRPTRKKVPERLAVLPGPHSVPVQKLGSGPRNALRSCS